MGSCLGVVIKITLHEEIMEISTRGTQKKICCFILLRPPRPPLSQASQRGNKSCVSMSTNAKHAAPYRLSQKPESFDIMIVGEWIVKEEMQMSVL